MIVMERMMYTVKEISEALGMGTNQTYALVKSNDFPSIKIGQQYFIPKDLFEEWIRKRAGSDK